MIVFFTLLLGHLIGDFPLQTNSVFQLKTRSNTGLLVHVSIHLLVTSILLLDPLSAWPALLFLGSAHFLIDWIKLRIPAIYETPGFVLDQLAHTAVLVFISMAGAELALRPMPLWLLFLALSAAFVPALAMFIWLLGRDLALLRHKRRVEGRQLSPGLWLLISQRSGIVLVVCLALTWLLVW